MESKDGKWRVRNWRRMLTKDEEYFDEGCLVMDSQQRNQSEGLLSGEVRNLDIYGLKRCLDYVKWTLKRSLASHYARGTPPMIISKDMSSSQDKGSSAFVNFRLVTFHPSPPWYKPNLKKWSVILIVTSQIKLNIFSKYRDLHNRCEWRVRPFLQIRLLSRRRTMGSEPYEVTRPKLPKDDVDQRWRIFSRRMVDDEFSTKETIGKTVVGGVLL